MTLETIGPGEGKVLTHFASLAEIERWRMQFDPSRWIDRGWCKTYGRVWYIDIEAGLLPVYHGEATLSNAGLRTINGLRDKLTSIASQLVAPDGTTGLPARPRTDNLGEFWVDYGVVRVQPELTGKKPKVKDTGGIAHMDHEGLAPYPGMMFDLNTRAYSAVLCLELPKKGGGLRFWPKRRSGGDFTDDDDEAYFDLQYSTGSLCVFDSFCFHQILPCTYTAERPARMIAGIHFLYLPDPYPHWEYWF